MGPFAPGGPGGLDSSKAVFLAECFMNGGRIIGNDIAAFMLDVWNQQLMGELT